MLGIRNFEFKKAVVFTCNDFEKLVWEVSYDVMGIVFKSFDGWFWTVREFDEDEEWEEWLEIYGEKAEKEIEDLYDDENDFIYRMIGRKYNAIVENIVVDADSDIVVVVFK